MTGLSVGEKLRFFVPEGPDHCRVADDLRHRTGFIESNILESVSPPFADAMDIIFCHNVLIYFRRWRRRQVVSRLVANLKIGGLLLVGPGELSDWVPPGLDPEQLDSFMDATEQVHPDLPDGTAFAELRRVMTRLSPRDAEIAATAKAVFGWHESHRHCARCGAPSRMIRAGWQRACDHCGAQHFPRTDPVVIMLITHGNAVLMGRSPGWPEGMYSLLAGFVEPGETVEAAVRREVWEEAGVRVGRVGYLASQPWPFPASLMLGCQGEALSREIAIDPYEIEDARWMSREEILAAFAGEHPQVLPARAGAVAHFLLRNWLADRLD